MVLMSATACFGYSARPIPGPSPERIAAGEMRVTLPDGSRYYLRDVRILGDSLIGMTRQPPYRRVAVAVAEIRSLESRGLRWIRTGGLAFGIWMALMLLAAFAYDQAQ
jgi:hypothetical protein